MHQRIIEPTQLFGILQHSPQINPYMLLVSIRWIVSFARECLPRLNVRLLATDRYDMGGRLHNKHYKCGRLNKSYWVSKCIRVDWNNSSSPTQQIYLVSYLSKLHSSYRKRMDLSSPSELITFLFLICANIFNIPLLNCAVLWWYRNYDNIYRKKNNRWGETDYGTTSNGSRD